MAQIVQHPSTTDKVKVKTRKFKFTPVPTASNLPNRENQAGEDINALIVQP